MTWQDQPSSDGFYWLKRRAPKDPEITIVELVHGFVYWNGVDATRAQRAAYYGSDWLWYGPLETPEEEQ